MSISFNFSELHFKPGSTINGKWNNKKYTIVRFIGAGENGQVYLVEAEGKQYALKFSEHSFDLSYEIKMIHRLSLTQGNHLGFSVFDIDDFVSGERVYPFYVMPYRSGVTIENYLIGMRKDDYLQLFNKIVSKLNYLHEEGMVFGDLKSEHILIDPSNQEVSLIDFGGLTLFNEGVRQYTELYDRASWRCGDRKANPHYDFFSLVLIFIKVAIGHNKFNRIFQQSRQQNQLYDIIPNINQLQPLAPILTGILSGKLKTAKTIQREIEAVRVKLLTKSHGMKSRWIEWFFSISFFFFFLMFIKLLYAI